MKFTRLLLGLLGYSAAVVLSFLIIIGAQRTYPIRAMEQEYFAISHPEYAAMPTPSPTPPPMPIPQPMEVIEPQPRIITLPSEYYIAYHGFEYTVFVAFGDFQLSFHVAQDIDMDYAMETVYSIVELFDLAYERFPGWPYFDYFLVSEYVNHKERRIYYNFAAEPEIGIITSMFFTQRLRYQLPWWLSIGLESYLQEDGEKDLLTGEELIQALTPGRDNLPFGDAWFIASLAPTNSSHDIHDIAYSLVSNWSENEVLYDFIRLAQSDTIGFVSKLNEYIAALTDTEPLAPLQFKYRFGDFEVMTGYGGYIFVRDNYEWTWPRVISFIDYMESSIGFIREHFLITNTDRIPVTLYPFGVINIPASIAALADTLGWDAPDVNFVTNDEIILASTSRFGTWAIAHEVTHIMLFREFPAYRPATWMVEGMAVLGEILFRDYFTGQQTYRFNVPTTANIDSLARNSSGHLLPVNYDEYSFSRDVWTYDEVGSFVFYLYNRFGMEPLLELYRSNNETQFEMALELFDEELDELMDSWRAHLWPSGEPRDWW
ncbi:MAG: hypothetical protein FWC73_08680 [Defluviitaleaceae bacterium]|nr:hypothetical protein [Defluviitaleaceae bacterium]